MLDMQNREEFMDFSSDHPVLQSLRKHWADTRKGGIHFCCVTSPYGATSGRLIRQYQNEIAVECLTWPITLAYHDTGEAIAPKFLAGLWRSIHNSVNQQSTILKALRKLLSKTKDPKEKKHLTIIRDAVQMLKLSEGKTMVFPPEAPIETTIRCIQVVSECFPIFMILEQIDATHSMITPTILQALHKFKLKSQRLMVVIDSPYINASSQHWLPVGINSLITDFDIPVYPIKPMTEKALGELFTGEKNSLTSDVAMWWTGGSLAFAKELIDWDTEETHTALKEKNLPHFYDNGEMVLSIGAMLGWRFPVDVLSALSGLSSESVRKTLDAHGHWVEINTSRPNAPVAYSFKRVLSWYHLRRFVLESQPEFSAAVADNIETFFGNDRELLLAACFLRSNAEQPTFAAIPRNKLWAFEGNRLWFEIIQIASRHEFSWPEEAWEIGYISAFRYVIDEKPDDIQRLFDAALVCFRQLERPHAEIQLFIAAALFASDVRDLDLMNEHFNSALQLSLSISDNDSNIQTRLRWTECLIRIDEPRLAMEQITLIESLENKSHQTTERIWLTGCLADAGGEKVMALNLYQTARSLAVEQRLRHISASSGLAMLPLMNLLGKKEEAINLHHILEPEVQGDAMLEQHWSEAKAQFI